MRNNFILVFLVVIFSSACKHDIEDLDGCGLFNNYYDSSAFGSFNYGTVWIYENQITLERDTFRVYDSGVFMDGVKEVGYFSRMTRSSDPYARWTYYQQETQNASLHYSRCEARRIWMYRHVYQTNGVIDTSEESFYYLPLKEGFSFNSFCSTQNFGTAPNVVEEIKEHQILSFEGVNTFTISGPSFSLNGCEGHIYRYQMGQEIGLISWENLDLMDGKWELVEFYPT